MANQTSFSDLIKQYNPKPVMTSFFGEWQETAIDGQRVGFLTKGIVAGPCDPNNEQITGLYLNKVSPSQPLPAEGTHTRIDPFLPSGVQWLASKYFLGAAGSDSYPELHIKEVYESLNKLSPAVEEVMFFETSKAIQISYNFSKSSSKTLDEDIRLLLIMTEAVSKLIPSAPKSKKKSLLAFISHLINPSKSG